VARVRDDHAAIRAEADALGGQALTGEVAEAVAVARALGERPAAHVRFEERVLFAVLERRLAADEPARLGEAVARAEAR
jgi:hypothetical protein